jgi:hypothetical protein
MAILAMTLHGQDARATLRGPAALARAERRCAQHYCAPMPRTYRKSQSANPKFKIQYSNPNIENREFQITHHQSQTENCQFSNEPMNE